MSAGGRTVRGRGIKRALALVFGLLGAAGLTFLAVGMLLGGRWEAQRSIRIAAPAESVFLHVDSLALWDAWTVWGDVPSELDGPGRGVGAVRSWDDPGYGSGRFEIVASEAESTLDYRVEVEGGALRIAGSFVLEPEGSGTTVTWREEGDFGRNPLLGYVARTMGESQGAELERSLERLREVVERTSR